MDKMLIGEESLMLTVQDVLNRKHFDVAKVVAGKTGLSRVIKWIHIMEVTDVRHLINGNELILTTGVVLKDNEKGFLQFVQQLHELEVAGLCVELGAYIEMIPESVINLANQLEFPLIVFEKVVPFVEITQDLHTGIIHQQYDILKQLTDYQSIRLHLHKQVHNKKKL